MVVDERLKVLTKELAEEIEDPDRDTILSLIQLIFDQLTSMVIIIDNQMKLIYVNPAGIESAKKYYNLEGSFIGANCQDITILPKDFCDDCPVKRSMKDRKVTTLEFTSKVTNFDYYITCIPLLVNHAVAVIVIFERSN